jgi:hypothetical protein
MESESLSPLPNETLPINQFISPRTLCHWGKTNNMIPPQNELPIYRQFNEENHLLKIWSFLSSFGQTQIKLPCLIDHFSMFDSKAMLNRNAWDHTYDLVT